MSTNICHDIDLCTGCTACANVCPKNCIKMNADSEGFLYPVINEAACINCSLCKETCPVNNILPMESVKSGFIARYRDMEVVNNSTSGGTCTAFAEYTFKKGGILYGVGYNDNMQVIHFGIDSSESKRVDEMRGSKYVQSNIGFSFKNIKKQLDTNVFICFTGTPCQVAGLKAYLRKDYENLVTVDLVCHGVSSPMIFGKYVDYMEHRFNSRVIDVRFRNKTYGYHSGTMMVSFENGNKYYGSGRIDYMIKAYFKGACSRKSCYQCPFKGKERCSDLTVFDSWNAEKLNSDCKDDDRGFTNIYVHTQKGKEFLHELQGTLQLWNADPDQMHRIDGAMISKQPEKAAFRDQLLHDVANGEFVVQMQKYLPVSKKDYVVEGIKAFLYKIGLIKILKRLRK